MTAHQATFLGLVCGYAGFDRSKKQSLMLRAFIDDSRMGQPPIYVLAGWVAPAKAWASFSDAWQDILWMSPRIEYFKFDEFIGGNGQFYGITDSLRIENFRLLHSAIKEHDLYGVSCEIPHSAFYPLFGTLPVKRLRSPYLCAFSGIITAVAEYCRNYGIDEKVEFMFDHQPGQMTEAEADWRFLLQVSPPDYKKYLHQHAPSFMSDTGPGGILALQAADLLAGIRGFVRQAQWEGQRQPDEPWMVRGIKLHPVAFDMNMALKLYSQIFGSFRYVAKPSL
jgi:hypothetical protein